MKIEMGDSLFLSWLRHVKGCQLVQLNWKPANEWDRMHDEVIQELMGKSNAFLMKNTRITFIKSQLHWIN